MQTHTDYAALVAMDWGDTTHSFAWQNVFDRDFSSCGGIHLIKIWVPNFYPVDHPLTIAIVFTAYFNTQHCHGPPGVVATASYQVASCCKVQAIVGCIDSFGVFSSFQRFSSGILRQASHEMSRPG